MFRFSLFHTIRTATRAVPKRRSRPSCRFNLETLEDRSVPAVITVGTQVGDVDLVTAINQSNTDATNHLTTPATPDIIQYDVGYTPPQLEGLVQNTGNLKIVGDLVLDDFATLNNTGTLHVTGNLSFGHEGNINGDMSTLNNGLTSTDSAMLTVDGTLALGDDATVENWGMSSISVGGEFSLGRDGTVYNGDFDIDALNADADTSISAASMVLGNDGLVYNVGESSISIHGDFTFGDESSQYYNGATGSSTASLSVGGNFSIGDHAFIIDYGDSQAVVTGNVTLGANSIFENGVFETDATNFTIDGNLALGDASNSLNENDSITNTGASTIAVQHNLTIYGQLNSFVENGTPTSNTAILTVGGQFSMTATGYFQDYGSMIVTGGFDAGTGDPGIPTTPGHPGTPPQNDLISGYFSAGAGSNVTTNTAIWEVMSGGTLDIAAGGNLTVPTSGQLTVDEGGAVTVEGTWTINGTVDPPSITVQGSGVVNVGSTGSLTVDDLIVTNSGGVTVAGTLAATTLSLQQSGQLVQSSPNISVSTPADQHILFKTSSTTPVAGSPFTVDVSADSGLPLTTFNIVTGNSFASISGNTVTISPSAPVGTVVEIEADQTGDANFNGTSSDVSYTVTAGAKLDQTITITSLASIPYGIGTFTLSASATSFLAVSFAVVAGNDIASVSGNTLTIAAGTAAGSQFTIAASQAGDDTFNSAPTVDQTITIGKASQSIGFGTVPDKTYGDADFTLGATSDSGLPVSYAITSGGAYASITGNTVHILGATPAGTKVTVEASQAGDSNHNAATPVDESFSINQASQSITFGAISAKTTSDSGFAISATSSSGLPVTFTATGSATVAQVGGVWTVQITGPGTATITAHQAGNANYLAAPDLPRTFTITAAGATITVPSGQQYTYTDPNGHIVSIKATGGATTTLSLQTVSSGRMQLNSMAVTGATASTGLTVTASGGTTINNLTIAGSAIHDINLGSVTVNGFSTSVPLHDMIAGSLLVSVQLTGGGYDVAVGSIGTSSGTAAATLSGGFHNVVFGLVLSGSSFTLVGTAHDLVFGDVATGATLSLGTSAQTAAIHDFVGGIISGSLLVNDSFHDGIVLAISGHVYLKGIGGTFITASWPAGNWVGADLALAGGGDILLGSIGDKSKVFAL